MQCNLVVSTNSAGFRCWQRNGFQVVVTLPGAFRHRQLGHGDALGSLWLAQRRFAGAVEATTIHCELEILSLSGTLSPDGAHLHMAVADSSGAVIGGHLCAGSLVRTTAELVIKAQREQ